MKLKIAVLPGDGIGPEVTNQSIKVLKCIADKYNHNIELSEGLVGAIAIDEYNDPYPDITHKLCMDSDAILFGAIGDPKYDNDPKAKVRPEQGLLKMRKKLGLFANLRPTIIFESLLDMSPIKEERIKDTNILFVRELTGGIYFGERGRKDNMQKKDQKNFVVLIKQMFLKHQDFGEKQYKVWKKIILKLKFHMNSLMLSL